MMTFVRPSLPTSMLCTNVKDATFNCYEYMYATETLRLKTRNAKRRTPFHDLIHKMHNMPFPIAHSLTPTSPATNRPK